MKRAAIVAIGILLLALTGVSATDQAAPPFRTPGGPQRVSLKGRLAYVADGAAGLQVVDFSTPSKPNIVGSYKTTGPARDVAVTDSLVFVVTSTEVVILRQTP